jgi:hypothetical protein
MIVEKILNDGYYVVKEHVNHVHTEKFQLIHISNEEKVLHTGTAQECEYFKYDKFPLSDGMS